MKQNQSGLAGMLASIGAACLIAGLLRYGIQGELLRTSEILLIVGGVLLLAGIVFGFGQILTFFSRRSSQLGTNTTILTLAVIVILGFVNFLGKEHHQTLRPHQRKAFHALRSDRQDRPRLSTDVNIVRFAKLPDPQFNDMMSEYKNLSSHLKFQNVDPDEKPDVAKDYGATKMGDVIVASGIRKNPSQPARRLDIPSRTSQAQF